jgi:hypothetical protein
MMAQKRSDEEGKKMVYQRVIGEARSSLERGIPLKEVLENVREKLGSFWVGVVREALK